MVYLTESRFEALGGEAGAVTAFERYEAKARQLVDRLTHGRLKAEANPRSSLQYCMVELINAMYTADQHGGREVASLSNDGVSVSYATAGGSVRAETDQRLLRIVRDWLLPEMTEDGVPLLYAGVDA